MAEGDWGDAAADGGWRWAMSKGERRRGSQRHYTLTQNLVAFGIGKSAIAEWVQLRRSKLASQPRLPLCYSRLDLPPRICTL
jgi:deoxyribodipyrimidine photolyase